MFSWLLGLPCLDAELSFERRSKDTPIACSSLATLQLGVLGMLSSLDFPLLVDALFDASSLTSLSSSSVSESLLNTNRFLHLEWTVLLSNATTMPLIRLRYGFFFFFGAHRICSGSADLSSIGGVTWMVDMQACMFSCGDNSRKKTNNSNRKQTVTLDFGAVFGLYLYQRFWLVIRNTNQNIPWRSPIRMLVRIWRWILGTLARNTCKMADEVILQET